MKKLLVILVLALTTSPVLAQRPCSLPIYRQFDFWIGEWEAFGKNGQKAGDSRISLLLDSCTLFEEWTSTTIQRGLRFAGKSFNMYNKAKQRWQQYWVDNTGTVTEYFNGHYENGRMIMETDNIKINDSTWQIQKMTFYNLDDDKLRQHGENSADGGKTWTTSFDLEYRRKK